MTAPEIFTDAWARAWGEELRRSDLYRTAAAGWEGSILMVLESGEGLELVEDRPVLLDLRHGECRDARAASAADREAAPFVLTAGARVWKRLLTADLDPLFAVMSGKLRLDRGNVARLLPYTQAAKEMVAAARRIEAGYPAGWEEV
jgi:putative sterol carrier protein